MRSPKATVQHGYDTCAASYERARSTEPGIELEWLVSRLKDGAQILDIGCGSGIPVTKTLSMRFALTGVDISSEQIRRAQHNVPNAAFICGDIMAIDFEPFSFDAIVPFYAIFHLPREEHSLLFTHIYRWLRKGGYLLATLAHLEEKPCIEENFFGATMYWSNYDMGYYNQVLPLTGFKIIRTATVGSGYKEAPEESHPIILAQAI